MEEESRKGKDQPHGEADLLWCALRIGGVGAWGTDLDTGETIWGDGMAELLRVPADDAAARSKPWIEYVHPDDRQRIAEDFCQPVLETGESWGAEFRIVRADGAIRWFGSRATVVSLPEHGRRMVGIAQDITERKEAEERLALALKAGRSGVFNWDIVSDVAVWCDEQFELFGLKREEFNGRHDAWLDCVLPADREAAAAAVQRSFETGEYAIEFRIRRHDSGEIRWMQGRGQVFFDSRGKPARMAGINIDITERKRAEQAEEALRHADRRKNEFLATLAHELRNALAPIRTAVEILNLQGFPDPTLQAVRDMIAPQIQHIVRMIEDLLDVARINQGKLELRKERIVLAQVLQDSLATVRPHLGHELLVSMPQDPIYLDADPTRLSQVFSNLLSNACKYTEKGGRIWLTAEQAEKHVVIKVRDTGAGIDPDHLPRVFEMFWQATAHPQPDAGLGVGLSLSRALVAMHGGNIEARSDGLGKGSEFVVRLPLVAEESTTQGPSGRRTIAQSKPGGRRVLVVDDNPAVASSLATLLRLDGNEVQTAHDGFEAVDRAAAFKPDLILLDIALPKMNGYDTCRAIRQQPWGANTVVVALTGWGQQEDRAKSSEAGFDGHLVKPVERAALRSLLLASNPPPR